MFTYPYLILTLFIPDRSERWVSRWMNVNMNVNMNINRQVEMMYVDMYVEKEVNREEVGKSTAPCASHHTLV